MAQSWFKNKTKENIVGLRRMFYDHPLVSLGSFFYVSYSSNELLIQHELYSQCSQSPWHSYAKTEIGYFIFLLQCKILTLMNPHAAESNVQCQFSSH